ncbi:MAG: DUF6686 family protein [Flavobacteriales bacterium]
MKTREILAISKMGCVAQSTCGAMHLCTGQLHFTFSRSELIRFIDFLNKAMDDMKTVHGYNKLFIATGIAQMQIVLSMQEVDALIDLLNEAELAVAVKEIL